MGQDPSAQIAEALDVARQMIRAGIPVFAAEPCPTDCPLTRPGKDGPVRHRGGPGHYHLPKHWEKTVPAEVWLDRWQPGWALAAVGGHAADFLDVDPRSGGLASLAEVRAAGMMPRTYGVQRTPSGGEHYVITPTGERKSTGFMPGLDLQSGAPDGQGRGFVWIAPTVRPSKDPGNLGELRAYSWAQVPDLEALKDSRGSDDSTAGIISRIHALRAAPKDRTVELNGDPFMTASSSHGVDRTFTRTSAQDFVRPHLLALREAKVGVIEETANITAAVLSHFVPAFWTAEQAYALLTDALSHTAYDPDGPSDWTAEKFMAVLDGRRPPLDNWKASVRPEPASAPVATVESAPGEETLSTLEKLRRRLVKAADLATMPAPAPLVHGLLDLDTESWLIGAPGSLKSFVALDIAGHVGRGQEWQGHRVEQRDVLYVAAEGQRGMVLRTRAWIKEHGDMEGVTFLPYPVKVKSTDGQWGALVELAGELRPGLVIIDTQARVATGLEENSATDMGVLTEAVSALRRATGACVLVIHHTGRNGGDARGSSALDGAQDTELKVVRAEPRSSLQCQIRQDKQKDMAEGDRAGIPIQFRVVDLGVDEETGRELSSLVMGNFDPFDSAQGMEALDLEPWRGQQPAEWTKDVPGVAANATLKRRILQVLADHAHQRGLTQAEAQKVVVARWYDGGKKPDADSWVNGWNFVTSLDLVVNVGGERWALDQAVLDGLKASAPI
jgi:hypothetical protein